MTSGGVKPKRNLAFPAVILILSVIVFIATFQIRTVDLAENHDPGPRALPWIIAAALLIGGLFEVASALSRRPSSQSTSPEQSQETEPVSDIRGAGILLGGMLLYFLGIPWLGFFICTSVFSVGMMRLLRTPWITSLLSTFAILLTVYLLFEQLFQVQLPSGAMGFTF